MARLGKLLFRSPHTARPINLKLMSCGYWLPQYIEATQESLKHYIIMYSHWPVSFDIAWVQYCSAPLIYNSNDVESRSLLVSITGFYI